jgi:chemotaxis signal transduction protein
MTAAPTAPDRLLTDLRRAFDQGFSDLLEDAPRDSEELLAIRVGRDPYALKLTDLGGLGSSRKIVPLPTRNAALLGVAGVRGTLVPVYSLAVLLGYSTNAASPRWFAVSLNPDPVALAFEEMEGFVRVSRADMSLAPRLEGAGRPVAATVRMGEILRLVVDTSGMVVGLKAGAPSGIKEG